MRRFGVAAVLAAAVIGMAPLHAAGGTDALRRGTQPVTARRRSTIKRLKTAEPKINQPIAYGMVYGNGRCLVNSGNVTVRKIAAARYEIAIRGHHYDRERYITLVTPLSPGAGPVAATWHDGKGKLWVNVYENAVRVGNGIAFNFVVWKP